MPEAVPWAQQSFEVRTVVDQLRFEHPGVEVDVWSPTAAERAEDGVPATYQEIVVDAPGPERYVIPLHNEDAYELWRVGVDDMPGAGELIGRETDLAGVLETAMTAAAAAADPRRVPVSPWETGWEPLPTVPADVAGWSPRVNSLASQALHGGRPLNALADDPAAQRDRDELRSAFQHATSRMPGAPAAAVTTAVRGAQESLQNDDLDATLRHLVTADDLYRHGNLSPATEETSPIRSTELAAERPTAVSNVGRSDMTAAAEVKAQARDVSEDDPRSGTPLREEEIELLARVDPAEAQAARTGRSRADWAHRRPERDPQQDTTRDRDRSVNGAD